MDLERLYRRLALGELSNLSMAEGGFIDDEKKPAIVLYANEALRRLHTKFLLKEDSLFVEMIAGRTRYPLQSLYARSNTDVSNTRPRYINDTGRPFTDDIIKVLSVRNRFGVEQPLNDPGKWHSVFTPQPTMLQIPDAADGHPLAIAYQAYHAPLNFEEEDQAIDLPEFLMGALVSYISYKVFSTIGTQESNVKAGEHLKTYESICIEAVEQDLVTSGATSGDIRFHNNGWV